MWNERNIPELGRELLDVPVTDALERIEPDEREVRLQSSRRTRRRSLCGVKDARSSHGREDSPEPAHAALTMLTPSDSSADMWSCCMHVWAKGRNVSVAHGHARSL